MAGLKKLTLLHSNDMHGDFLAEAKDNKDVGGVSLLSGYIKDVRNTEENVIYAIAGDMFRGSIIDSEYKGFSTIELMNFLSPDIVTLGNHEVDYGLAHLLFLEKCAKFPIVNANMYIKTNHVRLFKPYEILNVGGMNILFIGIITEEVLASTKSEEIIGIFLKGRCIIGRYSQSLNAMLFGELGCLQGSAAVTGLRDQYDQSLFIIDQ